MLRPKAISVQTLQLTIRLFIGAKRRWNLSMAETADVFDRYAIDDYIEDCYEAFHVQGDNATLDEIDEYLAKRGYAALERIRFQVAKEVAL